MKRTILLLSTLGLVVCAHASITINLDAERLKTSGGSSMPVDGLVILVASTADSTFNGPSPTAFVTGDDHLVGKFDLSAWQSPGVFTLGLKTSLSGDWAAGDSLMMYWFPTLTIGSTAPGLGTSYGQYGYYGNATGTYGPQWVTPSDGGTVGLKFFTTDASFLKPGGGPVDASAGLASLSVTAVPEPATCGMIAAMVCLAGAVVSKRVRRK
jgi:hypothetical protein